MLKKEISGDRIQLSGIYFGTLFEPMIVQAISIIYLILQVQPRVTPGAFIFFTVRRACIQ